MYHADRKTRKALRQVNKGYLIRKILIIFEIVSLFIFLPILIYSLVQTIVKLGKNITTLIDGQIIQFGSGLDMFKMNLSKSGVSDFGLTGFGIWMIVWAGLILLLGVGSIILVLTMKSPKSTTKKIERINESYSK